MPPPREGSTYELTTGSRIIYVLVGVIIGAPGAGIAADSLSLGYHDHPILLLILLLMLVMGVYVAVDALKKKVVFHAHDLEIYSLRGVRRIPFEDIKGCRIRKGGHGPKTIHLALKDPEAKDALFPSPLATDAAFDKWFASLPDADKADRQANEAAIINDSTDWLSPEERKGQLASVRKKAMALNALGVAAFFWGCFANESLFASACILAALPCMAMALAATAKNHYSLFYKPNDARGRLGYSLVLPGLALYTRILEEFHVLEWREAHAFALAIAGCLTLFACTLDTSIRGPRLVIFLTLLLVPYGYSCLELVDIAADKSPGKIYETKVLNKYSTSGGHGSHTYSLTFEPWGPVTKKETLDVLWPLYNSLSIGDTACATLYDGFLGIPWYKYERCEDKP
jgi:hypothetical protein